MAAGASQDNTQDAGAEALRKSTASAQLSKVLGDGSCHEGVCLTLGEPHAEGWAYKVLHFSTESLLQTI